MPEDNKKSKFIVVGLTIGFLLLTGGIIGIAFTANVYVVIAMAIIIAIGAIIGIATLVIGMNTQPESSTEITKEKNIELSEPEKKLEELNDAKKENKKEVEKLEAQLSQRNTKIAAIDKIIKEGANNPNERPNKISNAINAAGKNLEVQEINSESPPELNRPLDETQAKLDASPEAVRDPNQQAETARILNQQQKSETESGEREGRRVEEKIKQELRAAEHKKAMEQLENDAKRIATEYKNDFLNKEQKSSNKEEGEIGRQELEEITKQEKGRTETAAKANIERQKPREESYDEIEARLLAAESPKQKAARLEKASLFWDKFLETRTWILKNFSNVTSVARNKLQELDSLMWDKKSNKNLDNSRIRIRPVGDEQKAAVDRIYSEQLMCPTLEESQRLGLTFDHVNNKIDPVTGVSTELIGPRIESLKKIAEEVVDLRSAD